MGTDFGRRDGMLTVARRINAPATAIWNLLTDLDAWPKWGATVARGELHDGGRTLTAGASGRVFTPVGVPLPFEVTDFDDGRSWAWKVAGVQATSHTVESDGGDAVLRFGVPRWAPVYLPVFVIALNRIEKMVGR